jgi:hypothetical protein
MIDATAPVVAIGTKKGKSKSAVSKTSSTRRPRWTPTSTCC